MTLAEAVEALARAMGLWETASAAPAKGWTICREEGGALLIRIWPGGDHSATKVFRVTSREAMLWLRCALLGSTRERCPDCEGTRLQWEVADDDGPEGYYESPDPFSDGGWEVTDDCDADGLPWWTRRCPTCKGPAVEEWATATPDGWAPRAPGLDGPTLPWLGTVTERWRVAPGGFACRFIPGKPTGWVSHEHGWAERFLRAMPRDAKHGERGDGWRREGKWAHTTISGDHDAREQLTRLADQLQLQALEGLGGDDLAQHPDLGVWIALWLARSPCPTCSGWCKPSAKMKADHREHVRRRGPQPEMAALMRPCGDCHGEGTALAGYADAMAEAGHALVGLAHRDFKPDNAEAAE